MFGSGLTYNGDVHVQVRHRHSALKYHYNFVYLMRRRKIDYINWRT